MTATALIDCGWCGDPADRWPTRTCEEPENHILATYDCDCGDTLRVNDDNLHLHKRCREIGSATVAVFLFSIVLFSLFALAVIGGRAGMCHIHTGSDAPHYCEQVAK